MANPVDHVFVLMLENRSFDHLFGRATITGVDAETGEPTEIDNLPTLPGDAPYVMPTDPHHEFEDIYLQLTGNLLAQGAVADPYAEIKLNGFPQSYANSGGADPMLVMRAFEAARDLPALTTLAQEFAICDRWFSSLPGPTWPNRMFVHAASSGGLDHSPTNLEITEWESVSGFSFLDGSIFSTLKQRGIPYRLYSGDLFPMVAALRGISITDVHRVSSLAGDLQNAQDYPYRYVFIEPSYNVLQNYRGSSSMHPCGDVRDGDDLVRTVYEAIRNSPVWERSILLITWDEHGGFYDHVSPPDAIAPGDTQPRQGHNQWGFAFQKYGVRVPAIVVSPLIPKGTIDHRVYDHSCIPRLVQDVFGLSAMTRRDASARCLLPLLSLGVPRTDTPPRLPAAPRPATPLMAAAGPGLKMTDPVKGMMPTVLHAAMRMDLEMNPGSRAAIVARVRAIETNGDAAVYLHDVETRLHARDATGGVPTAL